MAIVEEHTDRGPRPAAGEPEVRDRAGEDPEGIEGPPPVGDFGRDTSVWPDPEHPGRYHADLSTAWKVFYAFGGCTMAVALRAARAAADRPDLSPVSATANFVAPVPCGPMVIDTEVMRSGRSAAQVVASLRAGTGTDEPGTGTGAGAGTDLHLSAVFGSSPAPPFDFVDVTFPDDALTVDESQAPPPQPEDSPFSQINYHDQTEFLFARKGHSFDPASWQPGPARSLTWHRLVREPRLDDGTIDPVSYCVPADILGPAIFPKVGPISLDLPPFLVLSLEISVQFVAPTTSPWLLQHCKVPVATNGYAYSFTELWDVDHRLVALATQRANARPVDMARFAPDGTA